INTYFFGERHILHLYLTINKYMSSKKSEKSYKPDDKKDKSTMAEINNIEKTLKTLSSNVNKLKTLFKSKSDAKKKNQ
ncbi:MAG: hypothetical protein ACTHME_00940, partial [Candidatus Nitrosocosmicus sp.]